MFDRFTPSGERAVAIAREEARRLGHDYLGTEHLLLGVLGASDGLAAEILARAGVTLDDARAQIAGKVGSGEVDGRGAPSTPRTVDVLVLAWQEARSQNEVGSEHILLALLREGQGVAAGVLSNAGITENDVRAEIAGVRSQRLFERFTEPARQVVVLAQEEARILKHSYIGTEHILLGLLGEQVGLAARALESFDLTVERVRSELVRIFGVGDAVPTGQIQFTPRAKKVLELAWREAPSLGHNYVDTEHILLGILRERGTGHGGVAMRLLSDSGAEAEKVHSEVFRLLAGPDTADRADTNREKHQPDEPLPEETATHGEELDRAALSDEQLDNTIAQLRADEQELSYRHRILHAKIDILQAERENRRGPPPHS